MTDEELLAGISARDERALGALYDRHATSLYSLAAAILGEGPDSEDCVADAFLRLWNRTADFDGRRGTVAAYLTVVVRSRALDRLRARRRRASAEHAAASESDPDIRSALTPQPERPDRTLEAREAGRRVRDALESLPDPQRDAISLAYYQGYSHSEIAERLAVPLGTVKTRIRDGMRKLREALAGHAEAGA